MDDQDRILSFLKLTGPVLPAQVSKHIDTNILLASAHLSELASQGKVKISHLKIGGSPVYYLPEHSGRLEKFSVNLNPKDQQTLRMLKEKKILKEKNLDLLARVSLRTIKDFAIPLQVTMNQKRELFWKWYLLGDEEANDLIRSHLQPEKAADQEPQEQKKLGESLEITEKVVPLTPGELFAGAKEKIVEEKKELVTEKEKEAVVKQKEEPLAEKKEEVKKGVVAKVEEKKEVEVKSETKVGVVPVKEIKRDAGEVKKEPKKPFLQKIKDKIKPKRKGVADTFFPQLQSFFKERNIKISTKETLRKNSEMDFVLIVPSVVGEMTYFCKAKSKKRCDEKDLSAAYMEAQVKKLPLLFLYSHELTKKAKEMIASGNFANLLVKKLD